MELLQKNVLISLHFLQEIKLYFSRVVLYFLSLVYAICKCSMYASWCLKVKQEEPRRRRALYYHLMERLMTQQSYFHAFLSHIFNMLIWLPSFTWDKGDLILIISLQ